MKKASKFDDKESITVPANQILAIITESGDADDVVRALNENGFSSDEIGILTGTEDAERLDAAAGKQGFLSKLFTAGVEMGDRDTDYLKQYRRALLNGRTVVGVVARDDEARTKARKVLKAGGARFLTYFGQFVTEVLDA
jgi:hypothetical protein